MNERKIENRILYLIVFILIVVLYILLISMQSVTYNFKLPSAVKVFEEFLNYINKWIPTILGIFAIFLAKSSLDHSKRSSLVKDSYGPILEEINKNKNIKCDSFEMFNFKYLEELKSNYLYTALEKENQICIEDIIERCIKVNRYKRESHTYVEKTICDILNQELGKNKYPYRVGSIYECDKHCQPIYKDRTDLFNQLFTGNLGYILVSGQTQIACYTASFKEALYIGREEFIEEFIHDPDIFLVDLKKMVDDLYNKPEDWHPDDEFYPTLEFFVHHQSAMIKIFKDQTKYPLYETRYEGLVSEINQLEKQINETIKKLLIPNYSLKKFFKLK
ncbi:hypothetical protein [Sporosarcina sp. P7]|uniref:hypothetical protein n=1 Tax=Sporosarcina sp. P7 TaxID=2048244 RepID=UPI000C1698CD|nr:hypothetical protein [Sporosarcina sp. P7]PID24927.1 hypothetical protein CSV60_06610 [Sporosarcina sp. P7]